MEVLRLDKISKRFGGVWAINRISFSVEKGERLAIIGPNGAGKTTLFNLINGQVSATEGRAFFYGEDITSLRTFERAHLGQSRAFQIISLCQNLSVKENTLLTLHGTKPYRFRLFQAMSEFRDVEEEAAGVLESLGLIAKGEEEVKNLSYGEQRRLEIGLSLATVPKLLLLDEPSAGLTKEESGDVIGIIKRLDPDMTVLIVDHDMDIVFEVATRIIVLHYGEIIADGTPLEIENDQKVKEIYMGVEESSDDVVAA